MLVQPNAAGLAIVQNCSVHSADDRHSYRPLALVRLFGLSTQDSVGHSLEFGYD